MPVKVANHIHDVGHARATAKDKAIGDMCLIAFYFLLRVGEYTSHRKGANTRTVQFRARDIVFWDENLCRIPNEASLEKLLQAHSATMTIDNQKNGFAFWHVFVMFQRGHWVILKMTQTNI